MDGASLTIEKGSITGLIGLNGPGKSTLFNVSRRGLKPTSGPCTMAGEDISSGWRRMNCSPRGLDGTFQLAHEFSSMTVRENLMMVPAGQTGETWSTPVPARPHPARRTRLRKKADEVAEF